MGAVTNGKLQEFRLIDSSEGSEAVYTIELQDEVYFPLQDARYNIAALLKADGEIAEWYRHTVAIFHPREPSRYPKGVSI